MCMCLGLLSGYGKHDVLWRLRSLPGFFSVIDSTQEICLIVVTVQRRMMISLVSYAWIISERQESIFFSSALSVNFAGSIWELHGILTWIFFRWWFWLAFGSIREVSWKFSSLLLGIFGSKGMGKFFAMSFPRSVLGGLFSKPRFFCICAEWRIH